MDTTEERLLTIDQVMELTTLSRAAVYTEMRYRTLPRTIRVGARGARWRYSELLAWMNSLEKVPPDVGG